ncbi:STAS domain-containing protein [Actinoallomurus soli]|uniref:STAS domain-containing protein n=1 Tax=Actinoallomurus soli TaxID=2952535 RepID=UPI002093E512|nr:STAS domain-containing protein [Actinoallomurus soli]MCO5967650.1 STAS domain-containing protein [Actinoallomurus soli]
MTADRSDEATLDVAVEPRGEWSLVHVAGELDYTTVGGIRDELDAMLSAGQVRIALDLSSLEFCDSVGLGCFVGAWKRARKDGGELLLLRPAGHVQRMLKITGLDRFLSSTDEIPGDAPTGDADLTAAR